MSAKTACSFPASAAWTSAASSAWSRSAAAAAMRVEGRRPVAGHGNAPTNPGGVGQAVPAQEPGEVGPAPDRGQSLGRAPVRAGPGGVGALGDEQGDQFGRAIGPHGGVDG